ncbi:MAG: glutamate--tRNA ligase [Gammaproteobacteria bacterium]|nr:glutamate--tRNA ligase [Gammaproteobacteria bacterium]
MTVKTRFAPSPTGYLHIGGARTALFSWLYAKSNKGQFILRIEDTDTERSTQEAVDVILEGMQWLGLNHDEGPFYQSQRSERYTQILQQLLDSDQAYYCYCSKEELDELREGQMSRKEKPRYNQKCRHLTAPPEGKEEVKPVIRFKTDNDGSVTINDLIKGTTVVNNSELDDLIIARSDGTPTYNFVVVVDDLDMGLSHIIRGDDHYNNTPRQMNILKALGAELPQYAHLPMILDEKGAKLSKRHGAANLLNYREQGYLPQALLNYLVRLGWSHGDQEIFTIDEMIQLFDLKDVNQSPSAINPEKLLWLNQEYIKNMPPAEIVPHLQYHMKKLNINWDLGPTLEDLIPALAERSKTLVELAENSRYFYEDFDQYEEKAAKKNLKTNAIDGLQTLLENLQKLENWELEPLHKVVNDSAEQLNVKMGKIAQPLRVSITGRSASPSIDITMKLIGKDRTLNRIKNAISYINSLA